MSRAIGKRVGVLLLPVLAACGVAVDATPRPYQGEDLALIEEALEPSPPEDAVRGEATFDVWMVEGERLVAVTRAVGEGDLVGLVESVVRGPLAAEEALGLRSAVASTTEVRAVTMEGSTARVDLSRDFALIGGEEQLLAVAQIVTTLAGVQGIETVSFALDGEDIPVPDVEGVLRARLGAEDVRPLLIREADSDRSS